MILLLLQAEEFFTENGLTSVSGTPDLEEYLNGGAGVRHEELALSEQDMQEEYFFVGLRMVRGVSLKQFEEQFGIPADQVYPGLLERLVREGVVEQVGDMFRLTEYGMDYTKKFTTIHVAQIKLIFFYPLNTYLINSPLFFNTPWV